MLTDNTSSIVYNNTLTKINLTYNECNMCHKVFTSESKLDSHINEIHKKTHYRCKLCDRTYLCKSYIIRHIIRIHGNVYKHHSDIIITLIPSKVYYKNIPIMHYIDLNTINTSSIINSEYPNDTLGLTKLSFDCLVMVISYLYEDVNNKNYDISSIENEPLIDDHEKHIVILHGIYKYIKKHNTFYDKIINRYVMNNIYMCYNYMFLCEQYDGIIYEYSYITRKDLYLYSHYHTNIYYKSKDKNWIFFSDFIGLHKYIYYNMYAIHVDNQHLDVLQTNTKLIDYLKVLIFNVRHVKDYFIDKHKIIELAYDDNDINKYFGLVYTIKNVDVILTCTTIDKLYNEFKISKSKLYNANKIKHTLTEKIIKILVSNYTNGDHKIIYVTIHMLMNIIIYSWNPNCVYGDINKYIKLYIKFLIYKLNMKDLSDIKTPIYNYLTTFKQYTKKSKTDKFLMINDCVLYTFHPTYFTDNKYILLIKSAIKKNN